MTTIDFALYPNGDSVKLYLYNEDYKKDVEFLGTNLIPFDETMILQSTFNTNTKKIGECRWDQILNKMVLIKIRDDKDQADNIDLAIQNWHNMNNPIVGNNNCCS